MITALLILLVPLSWLLFAKYWLRTTFDWKELITSMAIVSIIVVITIQLGKYGQTQDTEIWNGYVVNKERSEGTYEEPYDCNCTTDDKGNEHCSTCYRTHYTVDWTAKTTVGNIVFDALDSTWRSVYETPDPASFKRCIKGEPASIEHRYTNYVQAVPQSLFHDDSKNVNIYDSQVPPYPRVYDFYRINRVINYAGANKDTANKISSGLSESLKLLGRQKQANIIVILTKIKDPMYRYAVERKWLGGKKNDIVIFVGLENGKDILWADVMTWALNSGNELFHVTMRDGIVSQKTLESAQFVTFVSKTVAQLYDRPQMKSYDYLADEINPPKWVIILALIFAFGGSILLTYVFHKNEF